MPLATTQSAKASPPRLAHIRELDGIRGIAALMVLFHHVCFTSIQESGWPAPILYLRTFSIAGAYGVDLFFVLSGFLITSILMEARHRKAYYQDFYWKRALRILPLYTLCLIAVLLLVPGSRGYVLMSALFVSNFAWLFHIESNGPFWTLAIEEQFYLLWPTVVRRRSIDHLRRWAIAVALSAVVLRLIAAAFGHHNYYFTFFHCDGLASGAVLACWFAQSKSQPQSGARSTHGDRRWIVTAFLVGAVLFLAPSLNPTGPRAIAFAAASQLTGVTMLCATTVAFILLHAGASQLAPLRSRFLTFFGLISYALYMVHLYVLRAYDYLRGPLPSGDVPAYVVRFCVIFTASIALCLLTRYLIELPAMSLRRYVLARPTLSEALTPTSPPPAA